MRENGNSSTDDPLSWRRHQPARPNGPPQLVSMPKAEPKTIPHSLSKAEPAWKAQGNWRTHAAPPAKQQTQQHQHDGNSARDSHDVAGPSSLSSSSSRLSSSVGKTGQTHLAVPVADTTRSANHSTSSSSHNPWANGVGVIGSGRPNSSLKPSSIANGSVGRAADLGTSPPQLARSPPKPATWSLIQPMPGPAAKLRSLQIGAPHPQPQLLDGRLHSTPVSRALTDKERNANWMLTPTSSLPSLPGTPQKPRDSSVDSSSSSFAALGDAERTQAVDANALNRRREHESRVYGPSAQLAARGAPHALLAKQQQPQQTQQSQQQQPLPRTPNTNSTSTFVSANPAAPAASFLSRGLGGPIHSSPKRSPLAVASRNGVRGGAYAAPAYLYGQGAPQPAKASTTMSPAASPKLLDRTLAPIARLPTIETASLHMYDDQHPQHTSATVPVAGLSSLRSPGAPARRDSIASTASAQGGYSLSRSRRSSQVISPTSPLGGSGRAGVYRPPHLRNRGSVSGLRPSVAHYDRVWTPNLRGHSRSREPSVSLSRGGSRPPSSLAFYHTDTIPEHGTPDPARFVHRERLQSMSLLAGSTCERDAGQHKVDGRQFGMPQSQSMDGLATKAINGPEADEVIGGDAAQRAFDGASLVAKLEEQSRIDEERIRIIRQNRFDRAHGSGSGDYGEEEDENDETFAETDEENDMRPGAARARQDADEDDDDDNGSQEFFDLSAEDLMHYGASDGYALSRHGSTFEGRPPGDVFEIGDRLGPGLEHEGQTIRIAETTHGFIDQNADITGSQLEVVRKLGEGSYAVVYLVREVMPDDARLTDADGAFDIADDDNLDPARATVTAAAVGHRRRSSPIAHSSDAGTHPSYAAARALIQAEDEADETIMGQASEELLSSTLKARVSAAADDAASYNSPSLEQRRRRDLQDQQHRRTTFVPREFALKCLCKRDLPEEMLEVQRLEATIHQSIPAHPNIVTLYRTYETVDWLFLILEYCPGQDLYYWLEQAQDTDESGSAVASASAPAVASPRIGKIDGNEMTIGELMSSSPDDATPPSPSLLASTAGSALLSRRRVRLISRMFRQICDAVQFCHDRGISHRDIKPENFIVEDRRYAEDGAAPFVPDQSVGTVADSMRDTEARVIVKMTDFGLATADERCDDFDCGSKPYMAYECHNNVSCDYDPKQADIWSLGVVLLNLLFHRNPFIEPSSDCPSFAAYCHDPIGFLMESFDGLTEKVACYLVENVFCSVDVDAGARKRVSAGELSRWALGLVEHLELNGPGPGRISRGASMYATTPLMHSRTTSILTLPSMLGSPKGRSRSIAREGSMDLQSLADFNPDATHRFGFFAGLRDSLSPGLGGVFTPDVLPSPRFTPSPRPAERDPFDAHYDRAPPRPPTLSPEQQRQHQQRQEAESVKGSSLRQEVVEDVPAAQSSSPQGAPDTDEQDQLDRDEVDALLQCEATTSKTATADFQSSLQQNGSSSEIAGLPAITDVGEDAEENAMGEAAAADAKKAVDVTSELHQDAPAQNPSNSGEDGDGDGDEDEVQMGADVGEEGGAGGADGDGETPSEPSTEATVAKTPSIAASNNSKRRKRGARKGRTLAKQLKRSQSVENLLSSSTGRDNEAQAREAMIRELALASETLARQMSKMGGKQADSEEAGPAAIPSVSLSPPTAAAAAKYNLQVLANPQKAGEAAAAQRSRSPVQDGSQVVRALFSQQRGDPGFDTATTDGTAAKGPTPADRPASIAETASSLSSNWSSAAQRRERINERKAGTGSALQDSGRSKPMSWRDRNQSTTTFSSLASNSSISSRSSVSSESSSVYSTASAPAALTKRDPLLRSRSRTSGLLGASGLGTIAEREKPSKEVDASYLAGIFGGDEARAMERKRKEAREKAAKAEVERAERGKGKLLGLLQDQDKRKDREPSSDKDREKAAKRDVGSIGGSKQSTLDAEAPPAVSSSTSPTTSFVMRFRRPGSSSSSKSKDSTLKSADQPAAASVAPTSASTKQQQPQQLQSTVAPNVAAIVIPASRTPTAGGGIGLRRDASTSTSSLQATLDGDITITVSRSSSVSNAGLTKYRANGGVDHAAAVRPEAESGNVLSTSGHATSRHAGGAATLRSTPSQASFVSMAGKSTTATESGPGFAASPVPLPSSSPSPDVAGAATAASPSDTAAAAPATKKRGMGKFFSGMRDTLMNR